MRHVTLDLMKRAARDQVCSHCPRRLGIREKVGADVALLCEGTCSVFRNLPSLKHVAERLDPILISLDRALGPVIEPSCAARKCNGCAGDPRQCGMWRRRRRAIGQTKPLPDR